MMTPNAAKRIIGDALAKHGRGHRLTARTIDFSDLARESCIFVTVHDWKPDPLAGELEGIARQHGFRADFD